MKPAYISNLISHFFLTPKIEATLKLILPPFLHQGGRCKYLPPSPSFRNPPTFNFCALEIKTFTEITTFRKEEGTPYLPCCSLALVH